MKRKPSNKNDVPTIAAGMDDQDELNRDASKREIEKGEYTEVTTLSFDEVDLS